jgi:hypothetical protein
MKWLLVLAVAVAGCGGASPSVDWSWKLQKENQITALWTQIRGWRHDAHMDLEPERNNVIKFFNQPVETAKQVCVADHAVPKTCEDICDLSTAICDNAEAICGIANELGTDDTWAQDKCASAKASCREAKQRCCNCSKAQAGDL